MPLPLYGSGLRIFRMLAATSPTACLSLPRTTMEVGVDIVEPPFLFEMQRQGLTVVDAQQLMLDARSIKSSDEIMLLNQAAAMVDGVYQDIVDVLKFGILKP